MKTYTWKDTALSCMFLENIYDFCVEHKAKMVYAEDVIKVLRSDDLISIHALWEYDPQTMLQLFTVTQYQWELIDVLAKYLGDEPVTAQN